MSPELSPESPPIRWREVLLVLAGYLLVTAWAWWPLLQDPGAPWSAGRDYFQNVWNLWWTRFAWEQEQSVFQCPWLFHPSGTSLAFHTLCLANAVPGLVLQDWLPPAAAHTWLLVATFPLAGVAMWALARQVTGSPWGAFLAGLFYAFNPYHTAMVTQLNNAHLHWVPLFLLALLALYRRRSWWAAAWAGLFLALAGWADWYQPFFCVFAGGVLLLVLAVRERRLLDTGLWLRVLAMGALGALLMMPGVLPMVRVLRQEPLSEEGVGLRFPGEMQLLGVHPQGSPFFHFWPVALGYTSCLLLLWAFLRLRRPGTGPWWWLLGASFLFLQGARPVLLDRTLDWLPLPMAVFPHIPGLAMIRVPHRFLLPLALALAVLLAFALEDLLRRWRRRGGERRATVLALACCLLLVLELQPARRRPVVLEPPAIYAEMAADAREYAVLELPLDFRDGYAMYLQTFHGKPLVAGYTSHILPSALAALETPLMRALMPEDPESDIAYLPRHQSVDVAALDEATLAAWRQELLQDKGVGVIVFRHRADWPAPELDLPAREEAGLAFRLRVALAPFRFNPFVRGVETWRQLAGVRTVERLAAGSVQARAILERLFGPPDRVAGGAEIWDLRS